MDRAAEKKRKTPSIKKRMAIVMGIITACFFIVTVSLAVISIVDHEKYSNMAISQQIKDTSVSPKRGSIYDANMNVLAESATVYTVAISPNDLDESEYETVADGLSEILGVDRDTILEKCREDNYYSIIKRKVDQPDVDSVKEWMSETGISAVTFTEDSKRYYPYGNFLAQVLGFVGTDNYGLAGLEAYYNDELSGVSGRVITAQNALGTETYYKYETDYEVTDGYSLVLTVDNVIQHYLEEALDTAVKEHNVQNGACGIVMDVNTGEILAMATKGDFDPNDPFTITDETVLEEINQITDEDEKSSAILAAQQAQWDNKAISDVYEPGSVFKTITAATALETGAVTEDTMFYCDMYYDVTDEITMKCATRAHGWENIEDALINSCNVAFIQIGQAIGAEDFFQYFQAFGLTQKTGIDLPGEANSIYYDADELGVVQLASCSYGQSNAVTPLQMITAFSAVVNGGNLMKPYIVDKIIDSDGNVVEQNEPEVVRQVISSETSETMCQYLESVVTDSNGSNAYLAGYRVGGKSGTSQKLGGNEDDYVSSFMAFAPADDPQIAVLIILDTPKSYSIYGSTLVGPIVQSVMSDILPYIGVERVYTDEELADAEVTAPNVMNYSLTQAYSVLQSNGFTYEVVGDGTTVTNQYPAGGQSVPQGSKIILYTNDEDIRYVTMPDLTGYTVKDAQSLMQEVGLNITVEGSSSSEAVAVSQDISPGESVEAGTVVSVTFVDSSLGD
ncbi:MAG: penicillin-binding transpeptidase domain-containing protein [Oscillospiraceae bacterium]|jgi:stage V sporulation protein D (sporulation-specific penicillin-binding protein)